ncbi:tetratricopeptide repeat protein [Piscinibacter terrae]|uniref:Tetratricopeptide repeat protein n=1 Tax=Piscinibacter terrae TaxID=2496871 RepID=A0A3N7HWJ3_9BURK|nr:hypothetical protein [Albitalea terrae]RQP25391.1 hypothetical protein DZC73_11255 [Albitalea terrae]
MKQVLSLRAAALGVLVLSGCAAPPPVPPSSSTDDEVAPVPARQAVGADAFEQRLRERALQSMRQGQLADAATAWEILTVLRPEQRDYRDHLNETQQLIAQAVPERMQRGAQALKRGELDAAASQYLAALALAPDNAQAAEALRGIERERNKRGVLGKAARVTITRRASADARMASAPDRNAIEHATMLAGQGELDDAISLLERQLAADKRNTAACQLLADVYVQKAEKQAPRDKPGAIASLEKSLRLDAGNARATERLRQLKGGSAATVTPVASREGCAASR